MEVYRRPSGLLLLLGLSLLATTLQGVQGELESDGPSESECRPYIEKALKHQLETGDSKEDIPTAEVTDDSNDGEDETNEDGQQIRENVENVSEPQAEPEVGISFFQRFALLARFFQRTPDKKGEAANERESPEDKGDNNSREDQPSTEDKNKSEETETQPSIEQENVSNETDTNSEDVREDSNEQFSEDSAAESRVKRDVDNEEESTGTSDENKDSNEENPEVHGQEAQSSEVQDQTHSDTEQVQSIEEQDQSAEDQVQSEEETQIIEEQARSAEEQAQSAEEQVQSAEEQAESAEEQVQNAEDQAPSTEEQTPSKEEQATSTEDQIETTEEQAQSIEEQEQSSEEQAQTGEVHEETESAEQVDSLDEQDNQENSSLEIDQPQAQSVEEENESREQAESIQEQAENIQEQAESVQEQAESVEETQESVNSKETETHASADSTEEHQPQTSAEETGHGSSDPQGGTEQNITNESEETVGETRSDEDGGNVESNEAEIVEDLAAPADGTPGEERKPVPVEDLSLDVEIPSELRPRDHVEQLLKLDEESSETEKLINKVSEITLKALKKLYENAIKPLETLYKYRDLSNRHFGDAEIFSKPLILFMGPWSGGKSSIINYLANNEYNETSLRTGAEPSPAYFNILMHGNEPEIIEGTELAADFTFSGLQKFGQGLEERLRGVKLPSKLLEKVNIVEIPGILEVRKQVSRVFPFNDACQWFIDRADIIFLVYDPSKLDVGPETEAILDQLKGREHQTRIILNKADQVKPEELMRVQGALIWNISPLMSSPQPPVMYTTSLWSRPYEPWAPVRLLQAQERAFLRDLRSAIEKRIENKIASARRFAVRVRNHAKMVDCYLTTYYNHKSVFGNRKQVADEITEHPQDYHIYEGLSTLTNISRYDLPDPDVYRDFFKLNPLYEFQQLSATCTYFRGCPINRLDVAIAYDLPELVGTHKRLMESTLTDATSQSTTTPGS
ncbi:unnamed protein product [Phaedon cochleariae]|uniref:Dynamin-type G domain-containing protein n=1 Tax=Phaedon cochleariae TaxID=80249 RepID=A0A9P0DKD7_PHACE|nr:unnamed protein product [Phaedon cochleariae]